MSPNPLPPILHIFHTRLTKNKINPTNKFPSQLRVSFGLVFNFWTSFYFLGSHLQFLIALRMQRENAPPFSGRLKITISKSYKSHFQTTNVIIPKKIKIKITKWALAKSKQTSGSNSSPTTRQVPLRLSFHAN